MSRNPATDVLSHNALLILISCSLLYFITLGAREVQPYEEAYNATRARAVIEHNTWWDQSNYSLGGVVTAAKPPLSVWAQSFFMKPMHMTPMSVRLFSTLCAVGSLFLMYLIACSVLPRKTAILSVALLSSTLVWNHFARLGTGDIVHACFTLLCLYALLQARREGDPFRRLLYIGLYALSLAAAIETNLIASIIPLGFLVLLWLQSLALRLTPLDQDALLNAFAALHPDEQKNKSLRIQFLVAAAIALCCSLPWYVHMATAHGSTFWSSLFHPLAGADASWSFPASPYYINALLIAQPLAFFAFVWLGVWIKEGRKVFAHSFDVSIELVLALWFVLSVVVVSLLPLKQGSSVVYMVAPAILLSLRGLDVLMQNWSRKKQGITLLFLALIVVIWSSAYPLRSSVQDLFQLQFNMTALAFVLLVLVLMLSALKFNTERRFSVNVIIHRLFMSVIPIVLVLRIAALNVWSIDEARRGAQKTGKWLHDSEVHDFIILAHPEQENDSLCSQLSWYTQGWAGWPGTKTTSPWKERYGTSYARITDLQHDDVAIAWLENVNQPIVYVRPADDSLAAREERVLASMHTRRLETPAYSIFSRRSYSGTLEDLESEAALQRDPAKVFAHHR